MSSEAITCPIHRHIRELTLRLLSRKGTNLGLCENREKDVHCVDSRKVNIFVCGVFVHTQRSDNNQRAHGEKGTRLNEHGGYCLVQSTDSNCRPCGSVNLPAMQDESDDNHQSEEDVE